MNVIKAPYKMLYCEFNSCNRIEQAGIYIFTKCCAYFLWSENLTADADYNSATFELTFTPSDESSGIMCRQISILDDSIAGEPDEAFSVTLISASPIGIFEEDTTCITITDDDSKWH